MSGNHQQSRKMRKIMRQSFPKGGLRISFSYNVEERKKSNDFFPGGRFDSAHWTAKRYVSAEEVRSALESFHLVGREIWALHTPSSDYIHQVEDILGEAERYVQGKDEDSRSNIAAYAYLPKKIRLERKMEIDMPLVIEFNGGDTFEIDIDMAPAYYLSMNHIPVEVAKNTGIGVNPSEMFSDVIDKKIAAVDLETERCDTHPSIGGKLEKETEIVTAIFLRFENGSRLRLSGFYDFLEVASLNRNGEIKQASWETIRDGVVTPADLFFDRRSGFIARKGRLMFGWKGARCAGEHHVTLAPGPGWHHVFRSGREAYVASECSVIFGIAVGMAVSRYWDGCKTIDLTMAEWRNVLTVMKRLVESSRTRHALDSALMRSLFALELDENSRCPPGNRTEESNLARCFVEKHEGLLHDLKGWTRRALNENSVLRIAKL